MDALRATTLAIDEFSDNLALGGAPAGDNLPTASDANPYLVGAGFEHEGRRGLPTVRQEAHGASSVTAGSTE